MVEEVPTGRRSKYIGSNPSTSLKSISKIVGMFLLGTVRDWEYIEVPLVVSTYIYLFCVPSGRVSVSMVLFLRQSAEFAREIITSFSKL